MSNLPVHSASVTTLVLPSVTLSLVAQGETVPHKDREYLEHPDRFATIGQFLYARTQPFPEDLPRFRDVLSRQWLDLNHPLPPVDTIIDSGDDVAMEVSHIIARRQEEMGGQHPRLLSMPVFATSDHYFPVSDLKAAFGVLHRDKSSHAVIVGHPQRINALGCNLLPDPNGQLYTHFSPQEFAVLQASDWAAMHQKKTSVVGRKLGDFGLRRSLLDPLGEVAETVMKEDSTRDLSLWLCKFEPIADLSRVGVSVNAPKRLGRS